MKKPRVSAIVGQAPRLPRVDANWKPRSLAGGAPALQRVFTFRESAQRADSTRICRLNFVDASMQASA